MKRIATLIIIVLPIYVFGQVFSTTSSGDIESAQSWQNGTPPPFVISGNNLEIPSSIELNINHELSTSRLEVVNRGVVYIRVTEYDNPTIKWRNHGNIEFIGWAPSAGRFINELNGRILFLTNGSYCQHTGCGSENYGTIYVNTCLSNICAVDSTSRFINHESGEIVICEEGYIENYWFLFNAGSIDNVVIINNGTISYDESLSSVPIYNEGNDFFNNNATSMGTFIGNEPTAAAGIECLQRLPDLVSSISNANVAKLFSIYPNPSFGNLLVESAIEFDYVYVLNHLGQIENKISVDDAQSEFVLDKNNGIYFFQFIRDSKILANEKVIFVGR